MRKNWLLLFCLVFAAAPVLAQTPPPTGLTADLDSETGAVTLGWNPPFIADYWEDFEDGTAEGWLYDNDANWGVENGVMYTEFTPADWQWSSAHYDTETFDNFTFEAEVTKTAGTSSFSQALFCQADGYYEDGAWSGYMLNIAPADFGGAFLVVKIIDGVQTFLTPAWTDFDMNIGIGATNVQSIQSNDGSFTYFINGEEAFSWDDNALLSGYVSVGGAEDLGMFGRLEWGYVGVDDYNVAMSGGTPTIPPHVDHPADYVLRAPERTGRAPAQKFQPNGVLMIDGVLQDLNPDNELDDFIEYHVYRDGSQVGAPTGETYTDELPDFGEYTYTVTAFYDEGESDPTNEAVVNWLNPENWVLDETFDDGLPETWTIESTVATQTWHVDYGDERGLFPTPYMLVDSDAAGSGGIHLMERLITPELDVAGATNVMFYYSHVFDEYIEEYGYVNWSTDDGGTWNNIVTYDQPDMAGDEAWDVTDDLQGASSAWFSFYYDDMSNWGWYWAVDDVSVYKEGAAGPIALNLTPQVTEIPPGGGTLIYDATITNNTGAMQTGQAWTMATLPNGNEFGPMLLTVVNLPDGVTNVTGLTQNVPGFAAAGMYTFTGNVGAYGPNIVVASDSFEFEKLAAGAAGGGVDNWDASDWDLAGEASATVELPDEFEMATAYPNPFNPTTTVAISLPETAELNVTVFNVMGQQVAELASGKYNAGVHNLSFDASSLSSGLYFIQAEVPGEFSRVQKVSLVK
ncbi:MAG: hypothetical protein MAG453_00857 [Calditrichaeota bacterium]|nr:hypothetical protein [Calditrichota bacterium]